MLKKLNILFFYSILKENQLNIIEFFAWMKNIKNMKYIKINSLVLEEHTNAGKSLIIDNTGSLKTRRNITRKR